MSNLLIDFYNVYMRVRFTNKRAKSLVRPFFKYVNDLKDKFHKRAVYYIIDGDRYYKKLVHPEYKANRKQVNRDSTSKAIINMICNSFKWLNQ